MKIAEFLKNSIQDGPNWVNRILLNLNHLGDYVYTSKMVRFRDNIPNIDPERQLCQIANFAIANVPYYREKYRGLTISSADQFAREIELIDKAVVMERPERFIADGASGYVHTTTSGTSGKPLDLCVPTDRYVVEWAYVTKFWKEVGWRHDTRATYRRNHLPEGKAYKINPVTKEYLFSAFDQSEQYMTTIYDTMRSHGINTIYCYPSTALVLLKHFKSLGFDTSFIKYALLTSESVTPLQYDFITNELGIKIANFYGHTEKLVIARSLNGLSDFVIEPGYGYTEIVGTDGKPLSGCGDYGEIVGTTFYNRAMPLLRYRTGDYTEIKGEITDTDGVRKVLLKGIEGRREKSVIFRHDGSQISEAMLTFHGDILKHLDGIQYVQDRRGHLRCLIIPNQAFDDADRRLLDDTLRDAMDGPDYYSIEHVDRLIIQPNGKFLPLINNTL